MKTKLQALLEEQELKIATEFSELGFEKWHAYGSLFKLEKRKKPNLKKEEFAVWFAEHYLGCSSIQNVHYTARFEEDVVFISFTSPVKDISTGACHISLKLNKKPQAEYDELSVFSVFSQSEFRAQRKALIEKIKQNDSFFTNCLITELTREL